MPKKKKNKKDKPKPPNPNADSISARNGSAEPQINTLPTVQAQQVKQSERNRLGLWPAWLKGWKLFVEVATFVALVLAFYALRPILTAVGLDNKEGSNSVSVTVTDSGMPISHVSAQCITNKVVFADKFTLELHRYLLVNQYSVPDVKSGESFNIECPMSWSMWMGKEDGFFAFGGVIPGVPTVGIGFFTNNGNPALMSPSGRVRLVTSDLVGYANYPVTAVDGTITVRYQWKFSWFPQEKLVHVVGSAYGDEKVMWRVAPESEPVAPDGALKGFRVKAYGSEKEFGITIGPVKTFNFQKTGK